MAEKKYAWRDGAELKEHSRRKHKILREYFYEYLNVRCGHPQQTKFRLAIVDGFSGAGRYSCGTAGSPIIFLEELKNAFERITIERKNYGMAELSIECILILNDQNRDAIALLQENCAPLLADISASHPGLHVNVMYMNCLFENAYRNIREKICAGRFMNVIYNLDQCGNSWVDRKTIIDIMTSSRSVEIIFTFAIEALIAYLTKSDRERLLLQLSPLGVGEHDIDALSEVMSKREWLGTAERIVFESFQKCAPFVSPFSINNDDGWRYWLIHFATNYRARQVYNNVLHDNSSYQAHFGRSGLDMLAYEKGCESGTLYLFDVSGRNKSRNQLIYDIPKLVCDSGDVVQVGAFYEQIYNTTPAHSEEINSAMIDSPDIEVITATGGRRRAISTIRIDDYIRVKNQKSFFPLFRNTEE